MSVAEMYVCVMLTLIFAAHGVGIALMFGKNRRDSDADARFDALAQKWEGYEEDRRQTRAELAFVTAKIMQQPGNAEPIHQKRQA